VLRASICWTFRTYDPLPAFKPESTTPRIQTRLTPLQQHIQYSRRKHHRNVPDGATTCEHFLVLNQTDLYITTYTYWTGELNMLSSLTLTTGDCWLSKCVSRLFNQEASLPSSDAKFVGSTGWPGAADLLLIDWPSLLRVLQRTNINNWNCYKIRTSSIEVMPHQQESLWRRCSPDFDHKINLNYSLLKWIWI